MSLPPYKHTRNPCLQTADEPLIPGLAGAPLITYRCVEEKRRTSDQRVARIQNIPCVEFEYEYVPSTYTSPGSRADPLSRDRMILKPQIEGRNYQQDPESKIMNLEHADEQGPPGAAGDQPSTAKEICESAKWNHTGRNVTEKSGNQRNLKDVNDDAKSTSSRRSNISRRSLASHCSRGSHETDSSSKSQKSRKRCDSKESLSSAVNAVLKTPEGKFQALRFQRFRRIANGLDDDDLRPRRC